jgi:hypothetical protein
MYLDEVRVNAVADVVIVACDGNGARTAALHAHEGFFLLLYMISIVVWFGVEEERSYPEASNNSLQLLPVELSNLGGVLGKEVDGIGRTFNDMEVFESGYKHER